MNKIIITLVSVFSYTLVTAQRIDLGITGGVSTTYIKMSDGVESFESNATGFQAGGMAIMPVGKHLNVMAQLLFARKNSKIFSNDINVNNVQLPLYFGYASDGFFAGAGPGLSYGVSAKMKSLVNDEKVSMDLYDEKEGVIHFNRAGFNVNAIIGYRFPKGLFVNAHFSKGLTNLRKNPPGDFKMSEKTYGLSVGYFFR